MITIIQNLRIAFFLVLFLSPFLSLAGEKTSDSKNTDKGTKSKSFLTVSQKLEQLVPDFLQQGSRAEINTSMPEAFLLTQNGIRIRPEMRASVLDEQPEFWVLRLEYPESADFMVSICTFNHEGRLIDLLEQPLLRTFGGDEQQCSLTIDETMLIRKSCEATYYADGAHDFTYFSILPNGYIEQTNRRF